MENNKHLTNWVPGRRRRGGRTIMNVDNRNVKRGETTNNNYYKCFAFLILSRLYHRYSYSKDHVWIRNREVEVKLSILNKALLNRLDKEPPSPLSATSLLISLLSSFSWLFRVATCKIFFIVWSCEKKGWQKSPSPLEMTALKCCSHIFSSVFVIHEFTFFVDFNCQRALKTSLEGSRALSGLSSANFIHF